MSIQEIISKYYKTFYNMLPFPNNTAYGSTTYEDILSNICLTAIKKFGDNTITEEEGYEYLKKTLLMEVKFSKKRIKTDKIIYTNNLILYDKSDNIN